MITETTWNKKTKGCS